MKHLEFSGKYEKMLLDGVKNITIRKRTNLKPGDEVYIHCGGKIIGRARIEEVYTKNLEEITEDEARQDGFESRFEMLDELRRIGYKGKVYIIKFKLENSEFLNPHEIHYGKAELLDIAKKALECLNLSRSDVDLLKAFLKYGSIRKTSAKLRIGKNDVRRLLRKCYEELKTMGMI
ncbi:MAG: ASCH domain-containing protein [Archaeoglobales archaeon]|nr:ASCH domain-containing protein [Archaeoglobales archaeon]